MNPTWKHHDLCNGQFKKGKFTRAKPLLVFPDIMSIARSAQSPAAILAAKAECSLAYVSGVK